MNKFKFGDRVRHEKYGLCLITRSEPLGLYGIAHNHPAMAQIPWLISESELTPATDWVKSSERMPDNEESVMVLDTRRNLITQASLFEGNFYPDAMDFCIGYDDKLNVTHWMPLPAPPTEEAQ